MKVVTYQIQFAQGAEFKTFDLPCCKELAAMFFDQCSSNQELAENEIKTIVDTFSNEINSQDFECAEFAEFFILLLHGEVKRTILSEDYAEPPIEELEGKTVVLCYAKFIQVVEKLENLLKTPVNSIANDADANDADANDADANDADARELKQVADDAKFSRDLQHYYFGEFDQRANDAKLARDLEDDTNVQIDQDRTDRDQALALQLQEEFTKADEQCQTDEVIAYVLNGEGEEDEQR